MCSVSVIIPAFNLGPYLERAVVSVLNQTHPPIEILIVDNNSSDETLQVARQLEQSHDIVRIIQESQQGAPFARNRGLKEAKGEWIQYLDGDDLLLPEKLEYQLASVTPNVAFITSATIERQLDGSEIEIPLINHTWKGLFDGGGSLGFTSSILWRKSALHVVNGWNTHLKRHQEYDLMFRLLVAGYQSEIAPRAYTIKCRRPSGQISDIPYSEILLSSLALRSRILHHALSSPEIDRETMYFLFTKYFWRYTRLRVRRPDYALQIKQEYVKKLITPRIRRKYPLLYIIESRSDLYALYKQSKAAFGTRGLLGKIIGHRKVLGWLLIAIQQL